MKTKFLSDILLIEGIQVPVAEATYSASVGADAQMTFRIPYTERAEYLKPRSLIHFFWVDSDQDQAMFGFVGDLVAMGIAKSGSGVPSIVLNAVGHSQYWSSVSLFNTTGLGKEWKEVANFVGSQVVNEGGSSSSIFSSGSSHAFYNKLIQTFSSPPKSFPKIKGVLGGTMHLLEYVGGWLHGRHAYKGLNDFTSFAELRLKLMQQILASKTDSSSVLLLKKKGLKDWAKNVIGRRGTMVSFDQLLQQFFQFIFYVKVPVFAGPYFPGGLKKKEKKINAVKSLSASDRKALERVAKLLWSARGALEKSVGSVAISSDLRSSTVFHRAESDLYEAVMAVGDVSSRYRPHCVYSIWKKYKRFYSKMEKETSTPQWDVYVRDLERRILRCLNSLPLLKKNRYYKKTKIVDVYEPDVLGTVGIWPELLFSPPPRFNVLFPDFIVDFRYNRNIIQEPTRLMMRAGQTRKGDIFSGGHTKMKVFFAPDTPNIRGAVKMGSTEFAKSVMPHEVFTGIVPIQKQVPWAGAYKINAHGTTEYVQRLTNYEYLKARYQSRQGQIRCVFRPQLVVGMPMLIIPSYVTDEKKLGEYLAVKDKDAKAEEMVPDAYLGYCQSITHTLSPSGSSTTVTATYLRRHREDEGMDKTKKVKVRIGTKRQKKLRYLTVLIEDGLGGDPAALVRKHLGLEVDHAEYWRVAQQTEVFIYYLEKKNGKVRWGYGTWRGTVGYKLKDRGNYSEIVSNQYEVKTGRVYRVAVLDNGTVKVPIYGAKEVHLSFEDMVTPPWLDKKWHPQHIDKTYDELFGATSILDPVQESFETCMITDLIIPDDDDERER